MRRLILSFILIVSTAVLYSQSMSVKSFKLLETDLDANTAGLSKTDQNGEIAALIKVVTTQTGFTFDGGSLSIVATKQTPGEIWVYIPRGSKKITIKHPQLGVLRDYFFPCPIEAARTYEMILITGSVQTIVNEDAGGQYLVMIVDPPTATVYIDDKEATLQDGMLSNFLPYGKHTYRVSDPLYTSDAGTFEIGNEKKEIKVNLSPSYGILDISTTPENGAKVYLDSNTDPIGITPFSSKKIMKGQHKFRFQLSEYETKTIIHDVHSDGSTKPLIVPLNPNYANITINTPENCELYINNDKKSNGVWKGRLSEGLYRLEARRPGYQSTTQTLSVVKGEDQTVSMQSPTPFYGGLNINSSPIGATIQIDGETKGTTPAIIQNILIGEHNITLTQKGYNSKTQQINIENGKITKLIITLEKDAKNNEKEITKNEKETEEAVTLPSKREVPIKPIYTNEELLQISKQLKKDPEGLVKIGRELFDHKQIEEATTFANNALKTQKMCAPAYILLGDIEAMNGNGGQAASYYDQAIYCDPKNPEGYIKYATLYCKISPTQAVKKLQDLKTYRPDVNIDALTGHIYMLGYNEKAAYESYTKCDINKLDINGLNEFMRASYFTGNFNDAVRAAEMGLKIEPRNPIFNRIAMFSYYELRNYETAKWYINKYFKESDNPKISEYDHFYAALIYQALEDKTNMHNHYNKALELTSESSIIKRWTILKSISDSYLKNKEFVNAIKYYEQYLACKPDLNFDDEEGMANIFSKYGDADETRKAEMTKKAADLFGTLAEKYPIQQVYATFMRAGLNNKLDDNMKNSLAKADYQKVVDLLANKADRSKGENTMLKTSYHYLMYNAFLNKDKAGAKDIAEKILAIDPEYKPALEIQKLK